MLKDIYIHMYDSYNIHILKWGLTIQFCNAILLIYYRVWSVKYNHFHDQLVLSSSSDSRVILNSVVSLSSEPYGNLADNDDDDSDDDKDLNRSVDYEFIVKKITCVTTFF